MAEKPTPEWKPIDHLPLIGTMIDTSLKDNEAFYQTLLDGKSKPHLFDDSSVERILKVYAEQREDHWVFEEQVARWRMTELPLGTLKELDRLDRQLVKAKEVLDGILFLAAELKRGTIDTILAKDDLDLAFDYLEGKRTLPIDVPFGRNRPPERPPGQPPVALSPEQLHIASQIDAKIKKLLKRNVAVVEILKEMHDYMPAFKRLLDTCKQAEIDELCRQYFGFFHYAEILEDLVRGIQSGEIEVPGDGSRGGAGS